jgi:NIMA-interacting peptidyl-prolyl cis-trans isomerase 1
MSENVMHPDFLSPPPRVGFVLRCAGALCLLVSACAPHRVPPLRAAAAAPVAPAAPPAASPDAKAVSPELIEVRLLVVAYAGADQAAETVKRTKPEARERARMLSRMARAGDRLAELVRRYSDRTGAGEDLGLFRLRPAQPGVFGAQVSDAASKLKVGEVSDAVEGPEGFFVIERRSDPPQGPQRIAARHILISYKGAERALPGATRSEQDARMLAEQIARRAKEPGADWAALAAQYTDEPGSKETGGDLGKFGRGQMVKSFENAAFGLPVGAISDVVASPFGFHVIQRYE